MTREEAEDYIREWCPYDRQEEIIKALKLEPILDKIRAEIEELKPNNPNFKGYFEQNVALNKVLEILDKYKGEITCQK